MNIPKNNRPLFYSSILAAMLIATMTILSQVTGASQEFFEQARNTDEVKSFVAAHPLALQNQGLLFALDGIFAILYVGVFFWLGAYLKDQLGSPVAYFASVLFVLVAVLDLVENYHIQSMLKTFTATGTYPFEESQTQYLISSIKFHLSYLAAFFYGLGFFRQRQMVFKVVGLTLWFVFIPFGSLVQNTELIPEDISPLIRAVLFISAFIANAYFAQLKKREEAV